MRISVWKGGGTIHGAHRAGKRGVFQNVRRGERREADSRREGIKAGATDFFTADSVPKASTLERFDFGEHAHPAETAGLSGKENLSMRCA